VALSNNARMARVPGLVSVIVPNYNSGEWLNVQLAALTEQDYRGATEIILADNGSRDRSVSAAREWARGDRPLRVVDASARRGPGAARNAGAKVANGDFLAFCDADDLVSANWLRLLVDTAREADLVAGSLDGTRLNAASARACFDLAGPREPHLDFLPSASGANMGIWADVFAALGGFDERSRAGEDVALSWNAQLRGYAYGPSDALVHKRFPTCSLDAARRFFGYGLGDAWLYSNFAAAGMPRRDPRSTVELWRVLARGFSAMPPPAQRCRWTTAVALSCGRLAGSARHRVVFT
jgi:glycosyltransferase involved in cell wall biosynthesis